MSDFQDRNPFPDDPAGPRGPEGGGGATGGSVHQVVFRWDGNHGRQGTGMNAVAHSCDPGRAGELGRELGPLLWVSGAAAARPSVVRTLSRDGDVLLVQRWPTTDRGGRPSTVSHVLIGDRQALGPGRCLGLAYGGWREQATVEQASGRRPRIDCAKLDALAEGRRPGMLELLPGVERALILATAELLRDPAQRVSLLLEEQAPRGWPRRDEVPLVYLGLFLLFGSWLGRPWTFATCDAVDTHPLRLMSVPRWEPDSGGFGPLARVVGRVPDRVRFEHRAAARLVGHLLAHRQAPPGVPQLADGLADGASWSWERRRARLQEILDTSRPSGARSAAPAPRAADPGREVRQDRGDREWYQDEDRNRDREPDHRVDRRVEEARTTTAPEPPREPYPEPEPRREAYPGQGPDREPYPEPGREAYPEPGREAYPEPGPHHEAHPESRREPYQEPDPHHEAYPEASRRPYPHSTSAGRSPAAPPRPLQALRSGVHGPGEPSGPASDDGFPTPVPATSNDHDAHDAHDAHDVYDVLHRELRAYRHREDDGGRRGILTADLRTRSDELLLRELCSGELPPDSVDLVLDELGRADRVEARDPETRHRLCAEVLRNGLYLTPRGPGTEHASRKALVDRAAELFTWAVAPLARDGRHLRDLQELLYRMSRDPDPLTGNWLRRSIVEPANGRPPDLPPVLWSQIVRDAMNRNDRPPSVPPAPRRTAEPPPPAPAPDPPTAVARLTDLINKPGCVTVGACVLLVVIAGFIAAVVLTT
ncbi:hypothetical protein AB0420_27680 [Streptomyces caelestis]|uniref:hypothetical protein n=1 Tax=Streptomyces caelestis TaxID=36816 RepID=UPI00344CD317